VSFIFQELVQILSYVPRESQPNALLVSLSWYQILDQHIGVHAVLGRGLSDTYRNEDTRIFDSPTILKTLGVSTCEVIDFVNQTENPPKLKRPELLRRITFKNFVSTSTFQSLLDNRVTNLKVLEIDHEALYHLEFFDTNLAVGHCEALKVIESKGHESNKFISWEWRKPNQRILHVNAAFLVTKSFPGLKSLNFKLPYLEILDQYSARALLRLLINHLDSLTYVEICFSLKHPYYDPDMPTSYESTIEAHDLNHKLQKLHLDYPLSFPSKSPDDWEPWLASLRVLESLHIRGTFGQKCFEPVITQNAASLRNVTLEWDYIAAEIYYYVRKRNLRFNILSVQMFENCRNMTHLTLRGNWLFDRTSEQIQTNPIGLTSTASLPKTLIEIEITNIPLDNESCRLICLEFPVLKTLKLRTVAGRVGLGVQVPVVEEMVTRKQLMKFKVDLDVVVDTNPSIFNPIVCTIGKITYTSTSRHSNFYIKRYLYGNEYKDTPEDESDYESSFPDNDEDFL